ncbi:hypothetical protein DVH24_024559 [Malus domestica]|uniref:Uncharacterized protein n=1 Tax=Malus domestica TaxID=3750 RepID=A0A498JIR8_MALDO|nr:hypothetical protein DVH24_024559 [Malus domestica]
MNLTLSLGIPRIQQTFAVVPVPAASICSLSNGFNAICFAADGNIRDSCADSCKTSPMVLIPTKSQSVDLVSYILVLTTILWKETEILCQRFAPSRAFGAGIIGKFGRKLHKGMKYVTALQVLELQGMSGRFIDRLRGQYHHKTHHVPSIIKSLDHVFRSRVKARREDEETFDKNKLCTVRSDLLRSMFCCSKAMLLDHLMLSLVSTVLVMSNIFTKNAHIQTNSMLRELILLDSLPKFQVANSTRH